MSQAMLGSGAGIERGDGASPEVFTNVFEQVSISAFGSEDQIVEVTHLLSTAQEFINGIAVTTNFTLIVNYKPTDPTHVGLMADKAGKVERNFKLRLPTSPVTKFSFSGRVLGQQLQTLTANSPVQMQFTIKPSGAISGPA